jgi:hypothetical protein
MSREKRWTNGVHLVNRGPADHPLAAPPRAGGPDGTRSPAHLSNGGVTRGRTSS